MPATRNRSTLDRLDYYYRAINTIILSRQNPTTGLIPASVAVTTHGDYRDAWVRDNVYSILAVFGLALAYRRVDDNNGRAYELEHAVIKLMRGLLFAMMRQAPKVEKFKRTQTLEHSLHAKYNTSTGDTVVGDFEWGHLQIDATSIFLLALAQMTTSGLKIIFTTDEVDFVQNLAFYIERAYRTPDYGIWERGNKINHGEPELNSSSIGMAVAALQSINGVNLFGSRGGPSSVIHVLPDELTRNSTTLHSFLPRESNSKEIDAALLSVIGFPAFAVHDPELVKTTKREIITKLGGKYGCKRFLRDGHQTVVEDTTRLHYEPHELRIFENLESEWPLFFTYLILDGLFTGDEQQTEEYRHALEPLIIDSATLTDFGQFLGPNSGTNDEATTPTHSAQPTPSTSTESVPRRGSVTPGGALGSTSTARLVGATPPVSPGSWSSYQDHILLIPELYYVPPHLVEAEKKKPHSQARVANDNVPLVWANSLFFLGNLIYENLLSVAEVDPLGRRFNATRKTDMDTVVQIVLLAEDVHLQSTLSMYGLKTETADQVHPVTVLPPDALKEVYAGLGLNTKLGLSGRPKRPVGSLSTCRLYRVQGQLYAFTPHFMDNEEFYLTSDNDYLISSFETELSFVRNNWFYPGRPTMVVRLTHSMLGGLTAPSRRSSASGGREGWRRNSLISSSPSKKNLLNFFMNLRSGVCNNVRVRLGRLTEQVNTSNIESLDFLINKPDIDWESILRVANSRRRKGRGGRKLGFNERQTQASTPGHYYNHFSAPSTPHTPTMRKGHKKKESSLYTPIARSDRTFDDEDGYFGAAALNALANSGKGPLGATDEQIERPSSRFKLRDHDEQSISAPPRKATPISAMQVEEGASPIETVSDELTPKEGKRVSGLGIDTTTATLGTPGSASPGSAGTEDSAAEPVSFTLGDSSMTEQAITSLCASVNLYDQIDLLQYLHSCHGFDFSISALGATVRELLEEVYFKSLQLKLWSIVRQTAGALRKVVPSLTINITDLIIRQCQVSIGSGKNEYLISMPVGPDVLSTMIWDHCADDVREGPVVQEIIIYLGSFIRSHPEMFEGILRLRTHFLILALREEISRLNGCDEEEAVDHLMQLSPFELKSLLGTVLSGPTLSANPTTSVHDALGGRLLLASLSNRSRAISFATSLPNASDSGRTQPTRLSPPPIPVSMFSPLPPSETQADTVAITAQSGGFLSGNFARIEINGNIMSVGSRGLNVIVIDPVENSIVEKVSFDTHISEDESDDFAKLVEWLTAGMIAIVVAQDDCVERLTLAAKAALVALGSEKIHDVKYRDSWCLIGEKGAPVGKVPEAHKSSTDGPTDIIEHTINLNNYKRAVDKDGEAFSPSSISAYIPHSSGRWLRRRKNDGALNRVPINFYPKVWQILDRSSGLRIDDHFLPRDPTVFEKTPEEFNFALLVEYFLGWIADPAERQIAIEALTVISKIQERYPEVNMLQEPVDLTRIVHGAMEAFWRHWVEQNKHQWQNSSKIQSEDLSFEKHAGVARRLFYDLPQEGRDGTYAYLTQSAVLPFHIDYFEWPAIV
ncbi:hypothetical protein BC936DRAFT_143481 [Jimgerdemannia flammicorona]|uniref:Glycosyl hydrolases family 15-domain-containing protein n=1 Tax=Jimgerdemannia flammicorona TaxID=994334 RepID=A0A433DDX4_9FUNG|nr:hypothetical protein BC936DRAFT_143481 [Jimgerdemannia flammicorona]RUP49015.1 hypothetical protein BC936DRAFT_143481 [Jimgerdemannia flammicorona]